MQIARRQDRWAGVPRPGWNRGALPIPRRHLRQVLEGRPRAVVHSHHHDWHRIRRGAPHARRRSHRHGDPRGLTRVPERCASAGSPACASSSATPTSGSCAPSPRACRAPAGSAASSTSSARCAPCWRRGATGRWRPRPSKPSSASPTPRPSGPRTTPPSTLWAPCRPPRTLCSRCRG